MISRLTAFASVVSVFAAASLTCAASARQAMPIESARRVRIVQLEHVVVVATRLPQQAI